MLRYPGVDCALLQQWYSRSFLSCGFHCAYRSKPSRRVHVCGARWLLSTGCCPVDVPAQSGILPGATAGHGAPQRSSGGQPAAGAGLYRPQPAPPRADTGYGCEGVAYELTVALMVTLLVNMFGCMHRSLVCQSVGAGMLAVNGQDVSPAVTAAVRNGGAGELPVDATEVSRH